MGWGDTKHPPLCRAWLQLFKEQCKTSWNGLCDWRHLSWIINEAVWGTSWIINEAVWGYCKRITWSVWALKSDQKRLAFRPLAALSWHWGLLAQDFNWLTVARNKSDLAFIILLETVEPMRTLSSIWCSVKCSRCHCYLETAPTTGTQSQKTKVCMGSATDISSILIESGGTRSVHETSQILTRAVRVLTVDLGLTFQVDFTIKNGFLEAVHSTMRRSTHQTSQKAVWFLIFFSHRKQLFAACRETWFFVADFLAGPGLCVRNS